MIPINDLGRGFRLYQEEYEAKALEVLRSGWYILGKEVSAFEEEFAKMLSPDCYCAGVDNGLDAILVGLMPVRSPQGRLLPVFSDSLRYMLFFSLFLS